MRLLRVPPLAGSAIMLRVTMTTPHPNVRNWMLVVPSSQTFKKMWKTSPHCLSSVRKASASTLDSATLVRLASALDTPAMRSPLPVTLRGRVRERRTYILCIIIQIGGRSMPTHGSLSKAGKVRSQTPKIEARERRSLIPRVRNRRAYEKRIVLGRRAGQFLPGRTRR